MATVVAWTPTYSSANANSTAAILEATFLTILNTMNKTEEQFNDYMSGLTTLASADGNSNKYCGTPWEAVRKQMEYTHGVVSLIVCLFGVITNILNIIVLTRRDMLSATNTILTGLAVTDMLVMLDYIPFAFHTYIRTDIPNHERYAHGWARFTLFHAHFSVVLHTISIGLTLTLAMWRFIAVTFPQSNRLWCSKSRAIVAIVSCYLFTPVFCMPIYFAFEIQTKVDTYQNESVTLWQVGVSSMSKKNNELLLRLNFWLYSVLVKLIPCVALTILSVCLINALYRANRRKRELRNRCASAAQSTNANPKDPICLSGVAPSSTVCGNTSGDRSCDRTTRMLLAVLVLFLITEFPQGILGLLSGVLGEDFFKNCYNSLSEAMDFLALINSAINFILYCVMSRQFRHTFSQLFRPRILNNWIAIPQDATATTCV